jgi:Kef-type K+ transport system membrane component KefB/voltage-gated potassium channel Kch
MVERSEHKNMQHEIFTELSLVIVIAALVSLVMRVLRQPLILGYILTGVAVGPSMLHLIHAKDAFEGFSTIGIALLLFIIGLGMNISVIARVGKPVFITAAALVVSIGAVGFALSRVLLGFSSVEAYLIGLALFFSSTIIIVKALADKKEQNRLHGQIAIGVILLDDIVATLALLFVAAGKDQSITVGEFASLLGRGAGLILFLVIASRYVLPRVAKLIAVSQENLFLFAIAWGFGVASLFEFAGFSIEVGSLFAGVSLASLPYAQEIESRLKPLRDFFVVLFFITLGESLQVTNLGPAIQPALLLSAVVIILKPTVVTATLGLLGYPKRVAFKAGINLSQVSEFSIVLIVLAAANGLVRPEISAIITIVAMATITASTYLTKYDNGLFALFDRLKFFAPLFAKERKITQHKKVDYQLLLFGYHRGGHEFIHTFEGLKKPYLVVDYDPAVIELLQHRHIPCQYGDATDSELLEEVGIAQAKLIVSTITDTETNQELVRHINFYNPDAVIVCNANSYEEALQLYELGCSYVMIPHFAGSERLSSLIHRNGIDRRHFDRYRAKHLAHLEKNHPLTLAEEAI